MSSRIRNQADPESEKMPGIRLQHNNRSGAYVLFPSLYKFVLYIAKKLILGKI